MSTAKKIKGYLVFYINIEQTPAHLMGKYIDTMKQSIDVPDLPPEWKKIWVPTRTGQTRVELLNLEN